MHIDNPASRLLRILQEGKNESPYETCKNVWFKLLEVEDENLALLMSRLGKVMELSGQIVNQVELQQRGVHEHWVQQINTALSTQDLNGSWGTFIRHIDEHTINYLTLLSSSLSNIENTQALGKEDLSKIRKQINDLLTSVLERGIDQHFKTYIVSYLRKIITAIEEYKISGAIPIMESIEQTLGHTAVDEEYRKNLFETEVGETIITALGVVASLVAVANGLPQLNESFQLVLNMQK